MHCLLIEDRKSVLPGFVEMIEQINSIDAVHTAMHPYQVRYLLRTVPVSVVFCAPHLWNHEYFADTRHVPKLIFLSNTKNKIKEELDVDQLVVLKEPFSVHHLERLIVSKKDNACNDPRFMFVRFERRWRKVSFADIELIEKKPGSYVLIWTKNGNYLVSGNLQRWLGRLPADQFIRPCDNLIVPVSEVAKCTVDVYLFRGRAIRLTFRFAGQAKREMESITEQY